MKYRFYLLIITPNLHMHLSKLPLEQLESDVNLLVTLQTFILKKEKSPGKRSSVQLIYTSELPLELTFCVYLSGLRKYGHGHRAGVYATFTFCFRDPLDTMDTSFKL